MTKFVNETMTKAEQVDYAHEHRDLFRRCRDHNYKVIRMRRHCDRGRYISGWEVDAEKLLKQHADDFLTEEPR